MELFYVQLTTLLSLLAGNVLAGLGPLLILQAVGSITCSEHFVNRRNRIVTFLLVCGGGVIMSTCFLILIPQSRKHFEKHEIALHSTETNDPQKETFPIPEFIVLCGFFATFALEELLHIIMYHVQNKKTNTRDARVRFCSCAKRHTECSRTYKADVPDQTLFGLEKKNTEQGLEYSGFIRPTEQTTNMSTNLLQSQLMPNYGSVIEERTNTPVNVTQPPPMITEALTNVAIVQQISTSNTAHSTSNLLLLLALSCHAVLQGLNIGLASSTTWMLLLLLCLQQTILAFIVGNVGLSNSGNHSMALVYIATISIMSPVGIGITMILDNELSNELVFSIMKGLLCGSLLYFTFCDMLRRPSLKAEPHFSRFVGFSVGAAVVATLLFILDIL